VLLPAWSYLAQESRDLPLLHAKRAPKLGNSPNDLRVRVLIRRRAAGFQRDALVCMANGGNFRFLSASSKVTR
jgi:hypothetical protein